MDATLQSPPNPVTLLKGNTSEKERVFTVQCHDRIFEKMTVRDEAGSEIFTGTGKPLGASWSWRRTIRGTSSTPLFDIHHPKLDIQKPWLIDDANGRRICTLKHVSFWEKDHSAIDMVFIDKEREVIQVRPKDRSAITTLVTLGEACIADIRLMESNVVGGLKDGSDSSLWKARVAGGVDIAVVS